VRVNELMLVALLLKETASVPVKAAEVEAWSRKPSAVLDEPCCAAVGRASQTGVALV